nr:hypothetical protein [uncultured Capnocytophaga sp.]
MRKFLSLLLALILLFGCGSRKSNRTELKEEQRSERKEVKDSSTHIEKAQKVTTFDLRQSQSYEITLESDKDSVGNAKELVYYRIRDGDSETIRVQGGKAVIKVKNEERKVKHEADSTLLYNTKISTKNRDQTQTFTKEKQVQKRIKSSPVRLTFWLLLLAVLVFILWKYKPFR